MQSEEIHWSGQKGDVIKREQLNQPQSLSLLSLVKFLKSSSYFDMKVGIKTGALILLMN